MNVWLRAAMYVLMTDGVWVALLVPVLANNQTGEWWPGVRPAGLVALVLVAVGAALGVFAARELIVAGDGTPLPVWPTKHLVQTGPYAIVRNPMAIGFFATTLGAALVVDAIQVFLLPVAAVAYVLLVQHPAERRHLAERHGEAYEAYAGRVPAWVPAGLTSRS